jgi:uncharacterized protein (DUF2141 family)
MPKTAQTSWWDGRSRRSSRRSGAAVAAVIAACATWSGCDEKGPDAFAPIIGLGETGAISGRVTSGGVGIQASVSLTGAVSDTDTTDAEGDFFFSALPPGSYTLMAASDGFDCEPATAAVTAGQTTQATIACTPVATDGAIVGQVTVDGEPASGVTVTLDGSATQVTDINGMYAFDPVSPGAHDVTVTPRAGTTCSPTAQTVDVPEGGQAQADFSCSSQSGDLTVTVTVDGAPFGGATVIVSGPENRTGTTNTAGMAFFTGLPPGDYAVTASVGGAACDNVTASVPAGGTAQAQVTCTS